MKRAVPHRIVWPVFIIWILVTGPLLGYGIDLAYWNHLFAIDSRPVQGKVIDKRVQVTQGKHGPNYTYHVRYVYETEDLRVQCDRKVLYATWNHLNAGDPIPIKYLGKNPAVSRIDYDLEDRLAVRTADFTVGFGLFVLAAGGGGLAYAIAKNKLRKRLLQQGVTCLGRVTSLETEAVGRGQVRTYLVFSFVDNRGREIEGRSWPLQRNHDWAWKEGSPVRVYHDATDSRVFTVDLGASD